MAKKLNIEIDYFDGYQLLGIVSQLKDYTLAFHINSAVNIDLKKYKDFNFADKEGNLSSFSWYYYCFNLLMAKIYLISNKSSSGRLIPSKKEIDYFLLFKEFPDDSFTAEIAQKIRKIPNVMAVFNLDLNALKDADIIIENNELHEIEEVLKPAKLKQRKFIK
ncbi:MAG: IPExxxVDY family protein [Marinilabiliales bacterium]|nr:MAG: IPExxxVDY family protein [Marinilabiliales bacterium]